MVSARPHELRLVLFDMDDTLFDHSLTCRAALEQLRREEKPLASRPLDELWREYLRLLESQSSGIAASPATYANLRAERFRLLGDRCGWTMGPKIARELSARYRDHYQRLRRPVPGAVPFVRRVAARVRVGMVTNNEYREQEEKLEFLGLRDLVDPLVVSARENVAKPDPRIYRIALERGKGRAAETVMVGDSWRNDVLGARSAGIRPVWFNRFGIEPPTRHQVDEFRSYRPTGPAEAVLRHGSSLAGRPFHRTASRPSSRPR
ncbi:MAG: HAD family hydrolase [Thermoplasmata archaeon]|nr:HAD family hydrolase [Thermoplasmata archaeon]